MLIATIFAKFGEMDSIKCTFSETSFRRNVPLVNRSRQKQKREKRQLCNHL
uniref:Uncharacterized protein n=1 Tax=Rhizophagus irregularis (strain DAOM 181602 / DAOM 197198 / MUCL 43194) TaxID=747089 RepID=U9TP38_RHIID